MNEDRPVEKPSITVVYDSPNAAGRARRLAERLGAPLLAIHQLPENDPNCDNTRLSEPAQTGADGFQLHVTAQQTRLKWSKSKLANAGSFQLSFTAGRNRYRLQAGGQQNDRLLRAIGGGGGRSGARANQWPVLDCTSGLCRDAWAIAAIGYPVLAFERSNWLNWMQIDALREALQDPSTRHCASRLTLLHADAGDWLNEACRAHQKRSLNPLLENRGALYLDPMYPKRDKSAAVKKEMQVLQRLIGPDTDSTTLLQSALQTGRTLGFNRVVVKRPRGAAPLQHPDALQPAHAHESKNTRYDVYLCQSLKF